MCAGWVFGFERMMQVGDKKIQEKQRIHQVFKKGSFIQSCFFFQIFFEALVRRKLRGLGVLHETRLLLDPRASSMQKRLPPGKLACPPKRDHFK